ncbi:MAG: TonB-dependent receptor [Dinghuibacter sp.]|nr:TonB-dependent receptor [Dinghuibacter sp.]
MNRLNRLSAAVWLLCTGMAVQAQEPDSVTKKTVMEEATVTALKFPENLNKLPFSARKITNKGWNMNAPSMADVLQNSGAVFVQKSQAGGGSPVLRGFEASRVLLMVDGVRQNNAIYRTGHLQNVISIDPNILAYTDILYGPSSTIYGSDALGGVVNMFSKKPEFATGKQTLVKGAIASRYSSAMNELQTHADVNVGGKKWSFLTSITSSQFGDVVQGGKRSAKYPDFGKKPFYINTVSGTDFVVPNPNPDKQIASGYRQLDLLQKIAFTPKEGQTHLLNIQYSNSSDIPRYDRLTEIAGSNPRFANWHYGPQKRLMMVYQFNAELKRGFFNQVQSILSYQDVEESRHDRRFNNKNMNRRWERIKVVGYTLDAMHKKDKNESHSGIDIQLNNLRSVAFAENIITGARTAINTRYPGGKNQMNYFAVYYQHLYKIKNNLTLNAGARYTQTMLQSVFTDKTVMNFPFERAEQNNTALAGNIGITYVTPANWRLSALVSTGVRAPNIDDLAKVFDSRAGSVVVPNPNLRPEYTYNGEINAGKISEKINTGASIFYTLFRNAIVTDAFTFNGSPTIMYQGVNSQVLASQNKAKAFVCGANAYIRYTVAGNTDLEGAVTYTYGRFRNDTAKVPLDHVPPVYGRAGIKHRQAKWNAEVFTLFNGWKKIKEYNPNGEDNQQYATPDGMPSWFTLNLRTQLYITKQISALAGIENLLDRNYRVFASGISAPGRNFVVSLRASF